MFVLTGREVTDGFFYPIIASLNFVGINLHICKNQLKRNFISFPIHQSLLTKSRNFHALEMEAKTSKPHHIDLS
jgi:hypothetical protein